MQLLQCPYCGSIENDGINCRWCRSQIADPPRNYKTEKPKEDKKMTIKMTIDVTPSMAIKIAELVSGNSVTHVQPCIENAPSQTTLPTQATAPAQTVAPTQQPVQQQVPVAQPPTYNIAQIQQACAPLIDAGKQPDIVNLIKSFGVEALTQIPPGRLGEFATALRGLGAQI